jgi:DNA-binding MarR family transcriptional regulator
MADLRPTQAARLLQAKDDRKAAGPSNSVARALSILGLLNNSPHPLSFSDIKEKLELPKSTTSLLLSTLESLGYLTRDADDRRYWVSPQVYSPKAVPMNHQELTANAMPVLKEISSATRLTSFISVLEEVLFLAKTAPARHLATFIPGEGPVHNAPPWGKCCWRGWTKMSGQAFSPGIRRFRIRTGRLRPNMPFAMNWTPFTS